MPVAILRGFKSLGIGLLVDEAKCVDRLEAGILLDEAIAIEQQGQPGVHAQSEVMAALVANALVLFERLVVEHLLAIGALRPQVGWVLLALLAEGQLDRHQAGTSVWRRGRRTVCRMA